VAYERVRKFWKSPNILRRIKQKSRNGRITRRVWGKCKVFYIVFDTALEWKRST